MNSKQKMLVKGLLICLLFVFWLSASAWATGPHARIIKVSSGSSNGTYGIGATITVKVTFNHKVTVTGTPTLTLNTSPTNRKASYSSGSGSKILNFIYVVQGGDKSSDLDYAAADSLQLNGGTIKNAGNGNNAFLKLPAPGGSGSLGANAAIVIYGFLATTTAIDAPAVISDADGTVTVTVSSASGTPTGQVSLTVDGATTTTQTLNSAGQATFSIASPTAGNHSLHASYAEQDIYAASSADGTLTVKLRLRALAPHGLISPSGDIIVSKGANKHFDIIADRGYYIDDIYVDGVSRGAADTYDFTAVGANHTIEVKLGRELDAVNAGDVNGDGKDDIAGLKVDAVAGTSTVHVKDGSTGALIRTISFPNGIRVVDIKAMPDISGNGISEVALLCQVRATGNVKVIVKDALSGSLVKSIAFNKNYAPVEVAAVPDMNSDTYPELAVLGLDPATGFSHLQTKNSQTGAAINNLVFSRNLTRPLKVLVTPDINGSGYPEAAVLAESEVDGSVTVKVKELDSTGTSIRQIKYDRTFAPLTALSIPDINGDGAPEIGVLGDNGTYARVAFKDTMSGALEGLLAYASGFAPVGAAAVSGLTDSGGILRSTTVAVLTEDAGGNATVRIKDPSSSWPGSVIQYGNAYTAYSLVVLGDLNSNGNPEIGVIGTDTTSGAVKVIIKDPVTKKVIRSISIP